MPPALFLLDPRHAPLVESGRGRLFASRANFEIPAVWAFFALFFLMPAGALMMWLPFSMERANDAVFLIAMLSAGPATLIGGAWTAGKGFRLWRRHRRLLQHGQIFTGEVVSSRLTRYGKKEARQVLEVTCAFSDGAGNYEIDGAVYHDGRPKPPQGTPLAVYFLDADHVKLL